MWDEKSKYPKIETGYAFTEHMNDELVNNFYKQTFTQGSAILKIMYYNPKNGIVQHLPIKGKGNKTELIRMRNGYVVDVFTSVDIQVKVGGKVFNIYEDVSCRVIFKTSPIKKIIQKMFNLKLKYKDENNNVMQLLVKLIMNFLCGELVRKDIEEKYACK